MPDPNARSSSGPELPLADGDDVPGLSECDVSDDDDAETVDYETAEEDWYAGARAMHTEYRQWRKQKPKTPEDLVCDLKAFMQHCVTTQDDDAESDADDPCDFEQICADCYSASNCIASDDHLGYVELELSPEQALCSIRV